jgi:hypothetical protein
MISLPMLSACTIVARNYVPYARVLAESFLAHHPGASFTVLLIDDEARASALPAGAIAWLRLSDIGLDDREIRRLAGIYDVTELATAVKPLLLQRLLDAGDRPVVYLDPDISVYAPLEAVSSAAERHGIVLTPHTTRPFPDDDRQVDGRFILAAGVYNLGFIGVSRSARPFLEWWWHQTRRDALSDVGQNLFTDQRWVDFVPSFFDHSILKDPEYNVAYWNLHARTLTHDGNRYLVDGQPLRFFHFSGFDVRTPHLLSKHQGDRPRIVLSDRPVLARLCAEYAERLARAGLQTTMRYGWSRTAGGLEMTTRMRRLYRAALIAAERSGSAEPPDPFDASTPEAFLQWLNSPGEDAPGLSRYLHSIYKERLDLQIQFPDLSGSGARRFADWIWLDSDLRETTALELLPPSGTGAAARPVAPPASTASVSTMTPMTSPQPVEDDSPIAPFEALVPQLEQMITLQVAAEGRSFSGVRRFAQRLLFRILRPYAFQQHQLQMQVIAALRQAAAALRRQEQIQESLDARVREVAGELVAMKREVRRLERELEAAAKR